MWSNQIKRIHCIGVGGIGVSAVAEMLHAQGYTVSGSDCKQSQTTTRLSDQGIQIFIMHDAEHVRDSDLVVYSSAIADDNVELLQAHKQGIPCIKRGEVLAQFFNQKHGVAVVGSHGKSTTTGMVSRLLIEAAFDPVSVIGGIVQGLESPVRFGQGDFFVAEGDESDGSFLLLQPKVAVVTNIDNDHLDHYGNDYEILLSAFSDFLNSLPEDGIAILNVDDPGVSAILPSLRCRVLRYGLHASADVRLLSWSQHGMLSQFVIDTGGTKVSMQIQFPGFHNIMNAMAVCALAHHYSIEFSVLARALSEFTGICRRLQCHDRVPLHGGEVLVLEDYGHHPHAIDVTLRAVKQAFPQKRLVLVFQPHRYSRTKDLLDEFSRVLAQADFLILLDVYSAGESVQQGVTTDVLCSAMKQLSPHNMCHIDSLDALPDFLGSIIDAGDIILLQGAGSVGSRASVIIDSIKQGVVN